MINFCHVILGIFVAQRTRKKFRQYNIAVMPLVVPYLESADFWMWRKLYDML